MKVKVDIGDLLPQDRDLVLTLISRLRTKDANAYESKKAYEGLREFSKERENGLADKDIW